MKKAIFVFLLICSFPLLLNAWADWKTVSNQHFKIYYKENWEAQAVNALQTLEYYRPSLEKMTGGSIGQIPFTIEDLGNIVNGYTDIFGARIALFAYPPTSGELAVGEDWWQMVACHEYLHMLQMTRESGTPKLLRTLFGNFFYPHIWQPAWMTEGITVYGESQLSPYSGRLNGGTYPSIITTLAKKDKLPSPTKASYFSFDTPHASYYSYGGAFYDYLTRTYGDTKLAELFNYTSSSTWSYTSVLLPNLHLDKAYIATFGKNVSELWTDWQNAEKAKPYLMPNQALTSDGWFKSDLQYHNGKLYFIEGIAAKTGPSSSFFNYSLSSMDVDKTTGINFAKASPQSIKSRTNHKTVIVQSGDFPAGYTFLNNDLFYTRSEYTKGFDNSEMDGWGAKTQIWKKDLSTGKRTKLYTGQVRAFLPKADGSIIIAEDNLTHTVSTLYTYNPQSKSKSELYQAGGLVFSILEYKNKLILGMKEPWRNNSIYTFEPDSRRLAPLFNSPFHAVPVSIKGDELIFNAVFDGLYGAYSMNLQSSSLARLTDYSDVRTPVILPDGRIIFASVSAKGYDIYQSNASQKPAPIPSAAIPASPLNAIRSNSSGSKYVKQGNQAAYGSNLAHLLWPRIVRIPIVSGTETNMDIGAVLAGNDAVGDFPFWMAQIIYNTEMAQLLYDISLSDNFFHPIKHTIMYSNYTSASNDLDQITQEPNHTLEQNLISQQYMELFKRQNYGLTSVIAGFTFQLKQDAFERKVWTPFLALGLTGPATNLSVTNYFPIETQEFLPSDRERKGWQSTIMLHQKMPLSSEIKALAQLANDPDADLTEVFGALRGYDTDFDYNRGAMIQASWYKPVLKIRQGIWAPQVYVEDVNLGIFYDTALPFDPDDIEFQASYGAEILAELGVAYNYRLNLGVRFSQNRAKENMIEFIMGTIF